MQRQDAELEVRVLASPQC